MRQLNSWAGTPVRNVVVVRKSPHYNIVLQLRLISHLTFSIDSKKNQHGKASWGAIVEHTGLRWSFIAVVLRFCTTRKGLQYRQWKMIAVWDQKRAARWWVAKRVFPPLSPSHQPKSPNVSDPSIFSGIFRWAWIQNWHLNISFPRGRCILGNVEFSHHKSGKLPIEDGDSHNVTMIPHFHIIFRWQFEKVARLHVWRGQPPVSSYDHLPLQKH